MSFTQTIKDKINQIGVLPLAATALGLGTLIFLWLNRKTISTTVRNIMNNSYFSISELCASNVATARGIDNTPTAAVKQNLQALIDNVLDPLRSAYGSPIVVNSGYRSPALNSAVGGVSNSQHLTGQAADIRGQNNTKAELIKICEHALRLDVYDQLIFEHLGSSLWLHISYNSSSNRRQFMTYKGGKYSQRPTSGWQNLV